MRFPTFAAVCLVCLFTAPALAQAEENHVHARLLADVSTIQAGQSFNLGVELKIDPGWHVYWTNPGDAGLPTKVQFTLPAGYSVGQLRFPVPKRIEQPGGIVIYGYEDQVMLMATVTPPEKIPAPEQPAQQFQAAVSWLVCQDVCIPGKQKVQISLPAWPQSAADNRDLFSRWSRQVPVEASSAAEVASVKWDGTIDAKATPPEGKFDLLVSWKKTSPKQVQFFPGVIDQYNIEDIQVRSEADRSHITFTVRALAGQTPAPAKLDAVVGYLDGQANWRGFFVSVDLSPKQGQ